MASLQDIQRRISSTKKTRQITSAMQMVSTAKLSQIQKYSAGYGSYAARLEAVVEHLVSAHLFDNADADHIPLIAQRPIKKNWYSGGHIRSWVSWIIQCKCY